MKSARFRVAAALVLVFVGAIAVVYTLLSAKSSTEPGWRVFMNKEHHYSFRYPAAWQVDEGPTICETAGFCMQYTTVSDVMGDSVRVNLNFQGGFCDGSADITRHEVEVRGHRGTELVCRGSALAPEAHGIYSIARIFKSPSANFSIQGGPSEPRSGEPDTTTIDEIVRSFRVTD